MKTSEFEIFLINAVIEARERGLVVSNDAARTQFRRVLDAQFPPKRHARDSDISAALPVGKVFRASEIAKSLGTTSKRVRAVVEECPEHERVMPGVYVLHATTVAPEAE